MAKPEFQLLSLAETLAQIPRAVADLWVGTEEGQSYSIVEVGSSLASLPEVQMKDVKLLSQAEQVSGVLKELRVKISWAGALALLIVAGFLTFLLGFPKSVRVLAPPVTAAVLALSLSYFVFGPLTLFNLLAVYLIVALGLDYSVFYSEKSGNKDMSTYVGIHLSMFTSLLSFGLLSLSQTAAISGFGTTLGLGLIVCFFLCPFSAENEA